MRRFLRHRVSGFTVMEVLVTMVVSGIVVLTAFQFYNIFNKLLSQKNRIMEGGKEMLQFYNVIKNDASKSLALFYSKDEILMKFPERNFIQYDFYIDYVVRKMNTEADTFLVHATNLNIENEPTTGYGRVIRFEFEKENETFLVVIEKIYPNDLLMNTIIFHNK